MNTTRKVLLIILGVLVLGAIGTYIYMSRASADVVTVTPGGTSVVLPKANANDLTGIKLAASVTGSGGVLTPTPNLKISSYGSTSFGTSVDVYQNESITLMWQPQNADICNPSGDWKIQPGIRYATPGAAGIQLKNVGTYSFALNCARGAVGSPDRRTSKEVVTATVKEDFVRLNFYSYPDGTGAIPGNGFDYGIMTQKDKASWSLASSTNSCFKAGDWSGPFDMRKFYPDGTFSGNYYWAQLSNPVRGNDIDGSTLQLRTYTFIAVCGTHAGGTMTDSITVKVTDGRPEIVLEGRKSGDPNYSAFDVIVKAGDKVDLRATSVNSDSCSGINWNVSGPGAHVYEYKSTVGPIANPTSYGITCTNKYGSSTTSLPVRM